MVKLVDTLVSGTSDRKVVQVRVLFWAQYQKQKIKKALKFNDLSAFLILVKPDFHLYRTFHHFF